VFFVTEVTVEATNMNILDAALDAALTAIENATDPVVVESNLRFAMAYAAIAQAQALTRLADALERVVDPNDAALRVLDLQ
jgi:hypothetical protein